MWAELEAYKTQHVTLLVEKNLFSHAYVHTHIQPYSFKCHRNMNQKNMSYDVNTYISK